MCGLYIVKLSAISHNHSGSVNAITCARLFGSKLNMTKCVCSYVRLYYYILYVVRSVVTTICGKYTIIKIVAHYS